MQTSSSPFNSNRANDSAYGDYRQLMRIFEFATDNESERVPEETLARSKYVLWQLFTRSGLFSKLRTQAPVLLTKESFLEAESRVSAELKDNDFLFHITLKSGASAQDKIYRPYFFGVVRDFME